MAGATVILIVSGALFPFTAAAQGMEDLEDPDDTGMVIELTGSPLEAVDQESASVTLPIGEERPIREESETRTTAEPPLARSGTAEPEPDLSRGCLDDSVVRDTSWCANPPQTPDHVLICYEERNGDICPVVFPRRHTLLPNTPVRVIVRHRPEWAATITFGGIQGLYEPPVDSRATSERAGLQVRRTSATFRERSVLSTAIFGPRTTGNANVHVTLTEAMEQRATTITELIVEPTYSGALRVGIGMVFGGATSRTYSVQALPGSGQLEIVATGGGDVDMEIVVGFAPFVEAFWGGRAYHDGAHLASFPFGFSPYIGIGVVGTTAGGGVEGLTAFYFGLEWEPMRGLSVAGTIVARRVDRLQPGLEVGDPALEIGGVTRNGYELGWGVVISFSPDVLQVAGVVQ